MKPNHTLAFIAAAVAALALGACSKVGTKSDASHVSMAASPSAQLIGTTPAPATAKEPPGVTPVSPGVNESKAQQQNGPKEGDDSSHFTNVPGQKSGIGDGKVPS